MEGTYSIYSAGQKVGTAVVSTEGLYYRFCCECRPAKKEVCKIFLDCGQDRIMLGTPIPEGRLFVLRTKLPIKRFGAGNVEFSMHFESDLISENFIPVLETEPFLYLKDIKSAYAQVRGGVIGIVIPDRKKPHKLHI